MSLTSEVERRVGELLPAHARWSVSPEHTVLLPVDVAVVYRIAFASEIEPAQPGRLPEDAWRVANSVGLSEQVDKLRQTKERELERRLASWVEHAQVDSPLTPAICLGGSTTRYGYERPCPRCSTGCKACAQTGVQYVAGTLSCHVSRNVSIEARELPEDAPAWLRESATLDLVRASGELRRGVVAVHGNVLEVAYDGVIELRYCDVENQRVWACGKRVDFGLAAQRLLEPDSERLERAIADGDCAQATRAFFAAPLHLQAHEQDVPEASLHDRLVSPAYVERANELAQSALEAQQSEFGRGFSALLLGVPVLAFATHAFALRRLFAAALVAIAAWVLHTIVEWQARRTMRNAWGLELPANWARRRTPGRVAAWLIAWLAVVVAALPSVIPLRLLGRLDAHDHVSGIYASGSERLAVLSAGRRLVTHHVDSSHMAPCKDSALLELGRWGDFDIVDKGSAYLRSEGPSFVLLPDDARHCGNNHGPRFTKLHGALRCAVASERALLDTPRGTTALLHGTSVEVLPLDEQQLLVRSDDEVGTLPASDLECPDSLRTLGDTLLGG